MKLVAGAVPKLTAEAPLRPVPPMVTWFPPPTAPEHGVTLVTIGPDPEPVPVLQPAPDPDAVTSAPTVSDVPAGDWLAVGASLAVTLWS